MSALLTSEQAAQYLGVSHWTLARWRSDEYPGRPPALRVGAKLLRYRKADLDAWLESRVEEHTAA